MGIANLFIKSSAFFAIIGVNMFFIYFILKDVDILNVAKYENKIQDIISIVFVMAIITFAIACMIILFGG